MGNSSNKGSIGDAFGEALKALLKGILKVAALIVVFLLKVIAGMVSKIAEFIESRAA